MLFSAPAFLWGLLAVLIPVAIHLFNFRRYRKVYFSNVDRLEALRSESRRQSDVRRWLVLAARVLAIVFLVLAFAQPFIPSAGGAMHSGATVVSVYVDNTFSMESAGTGGSRLDAARDKAREVAAAYSASDRFQLLSADLGGEQMRWLSRDEFLAAVDALQPSSASPLLSEVASRQAGFMAQSGAANRHAFIVSDFQRAGVDLDRMPSDSLSLFTLVPLGGTGADNLYIDTMRLDAPAYFVGGSVSVEATLRNSGNADVDRVPIRLYVGGRERAVATVDLPSGSTAKVPLRFTIDAPGWADAYVEITDYPVTFDDRYWFTLHAGDRIAMLELDGKGPNASLRRLFASDSAVEFTASPQASFEGTLSDYDFIVLNEPQAIASGLAQQLHEWTMAGGSLLVLPPDETLPDGIGDLLSMLGAPSFDRWVKRPVRANAVDASSSLYRGVFGGTTDEMELPSVQGHYTLGAGVLQSIISLSDGGCLLGSAPCGQGRLYLLTAPLRAEWCDFASQALFVPTLYNMALYSRPLPTPAYTLGASEPIVLGGSYDPSARPPELTDGERFSVIPDLRRAGGRQLLVPHGDLPHDGIYTLADEHLAFNYDRRESQMDFMTPAEVADAVTALDGYSVVKAVEKPLTDELRQRSAGRRLWRLCIILALVALGAEIALIKMKK